MHTIIVGSITYAQNARRILSTEGIRARIVKTEGSASGCVYGVEIPKDRHLDAVVILRRSGLYHSGI